jgi:DNA adenine methylase
MSLTSRPAASVSNQSPVAGDLRNLRPFLRWAGSKRKLLRHLTPYIPARRNRYFEPFVGGASMFFFLCPERATVSDSSKALIETYQAVRRDPEKVLKFLRPLRPDRETFDRIKRYRPTNEANRAAQFIFLNKACWNGLYRVNSNGIFNVPFGQPRTDFLIDEENFLLCAQQLRRRSISVKCQDFQAIAPDVSEGDFVFLDPPYVTSHNMNGFVDWNECLFSWKDQIRLAKMANQLVAKKANVLITNAAHADVTALYKRFGVNRFERSSTLAGDTSRRGTTSEAIFFAGPAY